MLNSDYKNLHVIVIDDGSTRPHLRSRRARPTPRRSPPAASGAHQAQRRQGRRAQLRPRAASTKRSTSASTPTPSSPPTPSPNSFRTSKTRTIGAIAGNAKVGNRVNLWTRWQALEYITSQNFERRALDLFHVVTVVPGAIGAWRTAPVKAAGGYPLNTVAEDADLTMNLLEQRLQGRSTKTARWPSLKRPSTRNGLMRQRFRWSFGTLQAVWKHRAAFVRNKAMGLFALPNILIFQMLLPLVSPFIDLMFVAGIVHYFIDRHYHPEAASAASFEKLLAYFLAFLLIDFITSSIAFSLERRHPANKGDGWLLFHIWLQRFAYRQVFSIVLFKTLKRAIDGKPFNWDKLERTAKMSKATEALTETR